MKLLRHLFVLLCSISFFVMAREVFSFELPKTPSELRHDADKGADFLKWSLGPGKTDPSRDLSEASTFFKLAIGNAQTDFNEGIINEDYPALTLQALEQAAVQDADEEGKCYALTKSHRNDPPPLVNLNLLHSLTPGAILQTPLGKRGLANTSGECAYDSALQLLRMELLPLATIAADGSAISFPDYSGLNQNSDYLPYLRKFLLNQITTDKEAHALRLEMAQFVDWRLLDRPWDPMSNLSMGETGSIAGMSGQAESAAIRAWSYLLYLPSAMEESPDPLAKISPQTGEKYKYTAHLRQLTIPFLGVDVAMPMNVEQIIDGDLQERGRKMMNPLPPVMAYDLEPSDTASNFPPNPNENGETYPNYDPEPYDFSQIVTKSFSAISASILDPIEVTLPSLDASSTPTTSTLTPNAIFWGMDAEPEGVLCGHAFGIIQENGNWYEINNEAVFPIPEKWEKDIPLFLGRYPMNLQIIYTTSKGSFYPPSSGRAIAAPSLFNVLELHTKMLQLCSSRPKFVDYFCNYTFYWWAFYKEHPYLRAELDRAMNRVSAKPSPSPSPSS